MGDFERPKPKALTDSELTSALLRLKSESDPLVKSEELLSAQTKLRQQDEVDLRTWQHEISQTFGLDIITPEKSKAAGSAEPEQGNQEAVFTSQISIVQPKTRSARRLRSVLYWAQFVSNSILGGLLSGAALLWLGISPTDALIAAIAGSTLSIFPSLVLKVHVHHPLVRAAAFFGAKSSFAGAVMLLALFSWLMVGILNEVRTVAAAGDTSAMTAWDGWIVLAGAGLIALLGVFLRARFLRFILPLAGIATLIFTTLGVQPPSVPQDLLSPGSGWPGATIAVFLILSLIQVFSQPHDKASSRSLFIGFPLSIVLISGIALFITFGTGDLRAVVLASTLFLCLSLVVSVRDVGISSWSRPAVLLVLIPIASIYLISDYLAAPAAGLSYLLTVSLMDQLSRTGSLHLPSLGVGYGFYGRFQILTWVGLLVSITSGIFLDVGVFEPFFMALDFEAAVVLGLAIGLLIGVLRIPIVRKQNREINLVQIHNTGAKNLLGL